MRAGSILAWNQYLLHWGGSCSKWAQNPRISSGIYFQSADVEPFVPHPVDFSQPLPLRRRLYHACICLLNYHNDHHYPEAAPEYHDSLPSYLQSVER